jgi:hypothetical protein
MKIYKHFGITDEKKPVPETAYQCRITAAQILSNMYDGEDVLGLQMKENTTDKSFGYGLIYKETQEEFKNDMKVGKVEELVGKTILGFISEDKTVLQGLSVID